MHCAAPPPRPWPAQKPPQELISAVHADPWLLLADLAAVKSAVALLARHEPNESGSQQQVEQNANGRVQCRGSQHVCGLQGLAIPGVEHPSTERWRMGADERGG